MTEGPKGWTPRVIEGGESPDSLKSHAKKVEEVIAPLSAVLSADDYTSEQFAKYNSMNDEALKIEVARVAEAKEPPENMVDYYTDACALLGVINSRIN